VLIRHRDNLARSGLQEKMTSIHTQFTLQYKPISFTNEISFIHTTPITQFLVVVILDIYIYIYILPEDDPFGQKRAVKVSHILTIKNLNSD
jgi:hypothetical protein